MPSTSKNSPLHGTRKFLNSWTETYKWLHYDQNLGKVFCSICRSSDVSFLKADKQKSAFVTSGFSNWKKAIEKFKFHERSEIHRMSVEALNSVDKGINVSAHLVSAKVNEMKENRSILLKLFSTIRYLAQQGIALRGHTDESSNFINLLKLRSEDIPLLKQWLKKGDRIKKWTSHDIMNEMLEMLFHHILRQLLLEIRANTYFSILLDETTDFSRNEQVSFCIRCVDPNLEVHEFFLGFYNTSSTTGKTLFDIVQDIFMRYQLEFCNLRGQAYDGAGNVSGKYSGLQKRVREKEERAVFVHCPAHCLNLVIQDCMKDINIARDGINLVGNLISFVRDSPKRLAWFHSFKTSDSISLRPLCPTRWTMRHTSLESIIRNYKELLQFLEEVSDTEKDEIGSKASGLKRQLEAADTYIIISLVSIILSHVEATNNVLQTRSLRFSECSSYIYQLQSTLCNLREDFQNIWKPIINASISLGLESPKEPRRRKIPAKYSNKGCVDEMAPKLSPEDNYRKLFFELIDRVNEGINTRFSKETRTLFETVEKFMIDRNVSAEEISNFYKDDFDKDRLELHRNMLHDILGTTKLRNLEDVIMVFKKSENSHFQVYLPEIHKLLKIMLTIPCTTATPERSFSMLRRLKTYVRSTTTEKRLNHLSIIHSYPDRAKEINLNILTNEFIKKNSFRQQNFTLEKN